VQQPFSILSMKRLTFETFLEKSLGLLQLEEFDIMLENVIEIL